MDDEIIYWLTVEIPLHTHTFRNKPNCYMLFVDKDLAPAGTDTYQEEVEGDDVEETNASGSGSSTSDDTGEYHKFNYSGPSFERKVIFGQPLVLFPCPCCLYSIILEKRGLEENAPAVCVFSFPIDLIKLSFSVHILTLWGPFLKSHAPVQNGL